MGLQLGQSWTLDNITKEAGGHPRLIECIKILALQAELDALLQGAALATSQSTRDNMLNMFVAYNETRVYDFFWKSTIIKAKMRQHCGETCVPTGAQICYFISVYADYEVGFILTL